MTTENPYTTPAAKVGDPVPDVPIQKPRKEMIFLALCYGLLSYWLIHHSPLVLFVIEFVGFRWSNLFIFAISFAPWLVVYFSVSSKLPKLSLYSNIFIAVISVISTLDIVYQAYYYNHALDYKPSLDAIMQVKFIDRFGFWIGGLAVFTKLLVYIVCIIYPIFLIIRILRGRRHSQAI
jgi:hypothetical protein